MALKVSGIVLAGGRSSRFGGDKLLAAVAGEPLLHHAIRAMAMVSDEVIVVVSPARATAADAGTGGATTARADIALPRLEPPVHTRVVHDRDAFAGPLAGLRDGARAARYATLLVAGGDMPSISAAVLDLLVAAIRSGGQAAVLGREASTDEPARFAVHALPMALRTRPTIARADALLAGGERSLHALIAGLDATVIPDAAWRVVDPDGSSVRDVDRPEDLPQPA